MIPDAFGQTRYGKSTFTSMVGCSFNLVWSFTGRIHDEYVNLGMYTWTNNDIKMFVPLDFNEYMLG